MLHLGNMNVNEGDVGSFGSNGSSVFLDNPVGDEILENIVQCSIVA